MIRKLLYTIGLILLAELVLAYFLLFYGSIGAATVGYRSEFEERVLLYAPMVLMILTPVVIPPFIFRDEISRKIGAKKFWFILFLVLTAGVISLVYVEDIIRFLFA